MQKRLIIHSFSYLCDRKHNEFILLFIFFVSFQALLLGFSIVKIELYKLLLFTIYYSNMFGWEIHHLIIY